MNLEIDVERVRLALKAVRAELLAERTTDGHWLGQMSSSPLATATAVSALVVAHGDSRTETQDSPSSAGELLIQGELSELVVESLHWLARCQNADGGWGDCEGARSNLAATLLVQAAFRLTGVPAKYADLIVRADDYVDSQGGIVALRRWDGQEKLLAAPILATCALAGMIPWRQVPTLPFELFCVPSRWQHWFRLSVDPHAAPALAAIGCAKLHHDPPRNPLTRIVRRGVRAKCLALVERMQASDGGYLDITPLTAFVVMCLASSGGRDLPLVERGVEYLLASIRPDASWSIYSSLATRNTALALSSLATDSSAITAVALHGPWMEPARVAEDATQAASAEHSLSPHAHPHSEDNDASSALQDAACDWLLKCQRARPATDPSEPPGGWSWSDAPGAVPNVDDTAAALVALAQSPRRERIDQAAQLGVNWLLAEQGDDGGWPTFGSGSIYVFGDRHGSDSTAHAVQALAVWRRHWRQPPLARPLAHQAPTFDRQMSAAIERGLAYLETQQREDGSFIPLGFGNEHQPDETNPVCGTAQVLAAYHDLELLESPLALKAASWLLSAQHSDGGWGPPRMPLDYSGSSRTGSRTWRENDVLAQYCTIEETAQAVSALMPLEIANQACAQAVAKGLSWIAEAIEQDRYRRPAVVGWCFASLWYHERLFPLLFASKALSLAVDQLAPERPAAAPVG